MTHQHSYNVPRPALSLGLAGLLLFCPVPSLFASDHNTVGQVLAAMEKDAKTEPIGSAAAQDDSVAGLGILTDRLRAEAFLSRIPGNQRERLRQGYTAYQHWQAEALANQKLADKVRHAEGEALYGELQNRYKGLLANRALSEDTRDDIAYNRALLAVRHYRLMGSPKSLLEDALSYLKDVAAANRLTRADIPFLKARILDELGHGKAAAKLFHQIADANGRPSLAKALATVYSGDSYFADNLYGRSITRYSQALALERRLQEGLGTSFPRDFSALVRYRLMWAQHRNVNSRAALKIAQELLAARHPLSRRSQQDKMDRDSLDILTESLLQDFKPARFIAAAERIGTQRNRIRLAQIVSDRLIAKNQLNQALPVLQWQYRADPLGRGLPLTMTRLAIVYRAQQADSLAQQTALDLLRIYSPDSLWRRRHQLSTLSPQDQLPVTRKLVASTLSALYRTAMTQPNGTPETPAALKGAAEFHRTWLVEFKLSQADKATALERLAKLHLAQGDTAGSTRYAQQLAALNQSPAASQLAVVIAFKRLQKGQGKPHDLAKALDTYQESASYDPDDQVIGAIAAYYSEHGEGLRAERLWRSQLESGKSPYTRTAALRALLERKLQAKDYVSTMKLIERYSFDPRHTITPTPELDRVYHRALIGEFRRLKAKGQLVQATQTLQSTLASYGAKMPRQRELRDLLYKSLAATSQWQGIIKLYESPENKAASVRNAVAHQSYALALERSMRYLNAARQYYATAGKYPKLAKTKGLLTKALALAEGEDAYSLAGDVAFAIAKAEPTRAVADRYYRLAAAHYAQDGNHKGIQTVLNTRLHKKNQIPEATAQIYLALAKNAQDRERWRDAETYAGKAIATIRKVPVEDYTYQYRKVLSGSYYLLAKRQAAAVRGRDAAPEDLKRRLQADLKVIKTLKTYSQKVAEYGDPSDRLKMYSLLGVTSQTLAAQLADTRSTLAKRAGTDEQINGVRKVQTKLNTLAQHYFGKADLTLGQVQTTEGSGTSLLRDADRTAATAIAQPSTSMFRPDSYAEGRHDGTTWVH